MTATLLLFLHRLRNGSYVRLVHCVSLFVVYFTLALVLINVSDHVFSEQVTIRYYAKMLAPVLSKMYDGHAPVALRFSTPPVVKAQDLTTVLLVQDADLERFAEPYPVRYGFWARRLAVLAEYQPRAVFLDIFFIDKRADATLDAFIEEGCSLRRAGTPVYIGSLASRGLYTRPEIASASIALADGRTVNCFTEVAIPKPADKFDPSAWEYTLVQEPVTNAAGAPGQKRVAVAAQIYQDLGGKLNLTDAESMAMIWGARAHADNAILQASSAPHSSTLSCEGEDQHWTKVGLHFLQRMISSNKYGKETAAECFYHRTRPMAQLRDAAPVELERIIKGRVVMIAMDVAGLQDYVYSPVAEMPVPGVFLHAMALDNLLVFGERYKRHAEPHLLHNAAGNFALAVLFVLCLASAVMDVYLKVLQDTLTRWDAALTARQRTGLSDAAIPARPERRHGATGQPHEVEESALAGVENITLANPILMAIAVADHVANATASDHRSGDRVAALSTEQPTALARHFFAHHLAIPFIKAMVTMVLAVFIFYLGYAIFDFGPLTWAEFVFFPILCHFLFVGPKLKKMFGTVERTLEERLKRRGLNQRHDSNDGSGSQITHRRTK